jgi:Uncharacterized conserved protein (DUF2183)
MPPSKNVGVGGKMKNFKIWIFSAVVLFAQFAFCKTLLVADIDDTLRLTNRLKAGWLEQLDNAADPSLLFVGMDTILQGFSQDGATIFYVTAAISPLEMFAENFLDYNQLPQRENFVNKGWFNNTEEFKAETIQQLIDEEQPTLIVLLGDNGEADGAAYDQIQKQNPNVYVFIHDLYDGGSSSPLLENQYPFLTGADLAVSLEALGLSSQKISMDVLAETMLSLQSAESLQLVLPDWADVTLNNVSQIMQQSASASLASQQGLEQIFIKLGY